MLIHDAARPLIVLMHGDRKVSTKNLARQAGRIPKRFWAQASSPSL